MSPCYVDINGRLRFEDIVTYKIIGVKLGEAGNLVWIFRSILESRLNESDK
jgi:hypothetical protein